MEDYIISTDSTSDLYKEEIEKLNLYVGKLNFTITENNQVNEYLDNFGCYQDYVDFYNRLRQGGVARTSILNLQAHIDLFTKMAKDGVKNAIHITQSMGLSPTLNNANMAIEEVKKEFPDINYVAMECNTTTVAEGNMVKIALALRDKGYSMEENLKTLEKLKHQTQHFIIVNDLMYLKRGGRISGASATIGTLLQLKPIIEFTKEGKLEVVRKENGIKKAIKSVINEVKTKFTFYPEFANPIVVHTDNESDAKVLADAFKEEFGIEPEIRIMGPVIGSHVGPNAIALTFVSNEKREY